MGTDQFSMDEGYRLGRGHIEDSSFFHPGGAHVRLSTKVERLWQGVWHAGLVQALRDDEPEVLTLTLISEPIVK